MREDELAAVDRNTSAPTRLTPAFTNLAQLVTVQASVRPDAAAVVQPGNDRRALTWGDLEAKVTAVASGMASYGLVAGHRVALCAPNSIEFVVAYLAALRAGFVCVPVNPECTESELRNVLADSGARLVLRADAPDVAGVRTLPLSPEGLDALAMRASGAVGSPADGEALAVLLYTAGTSGEPKAAMLSHRSLLSHLEHFHAYGLITEDTVVLALLPLFHVFGLNAVLGACLRAGATCVVSDGTGDPVKTVQDEGVTNLPVAPSLLYRMLQHEDLGAALAGVTTVVSGAAPMPASLASTFTERTGLRIEQGYGLTEAAPGVSVTFGSTVTGPGHVGRPLPGVEVRIGDGRDAGEPAEIWVRGGNLFSGYWPDAHDGPDPDGWFATGDIGYLADGELFLVDRARELVLVNGFNVYPAEVESVIRELPGVEEVAVIGQPDERTGEQVVAFVVGAIVSEDEVTEHCASRLARFKRPTEVRLLTALPRGATGKVKKGVLRQLRAASAADRSTSSPGRGVGQ
ncbi:MAG TPA: AMP-binding protein [Propionibacteriaceae bacterium]